MAFTSKIGGGGGRGGSGPKGLGTGKKLNKKQRQKYANKKYVTYGVGRLAEAAGGSAVLAGSIILGLGTEVGKKIKRTVDKVDDYLKFSNKKENVDSPSGAKTVFQNKKNKK